MQLSDTHAGFEGLMPLLKNLMTKQREDHDLPELRGIYRQQHLNSLRMAQFDVTRDLRGTFYAGHHWKEKW